MELKYAGKTDIGSMREENQDALGYVSLDEGLFLAVADGMGGYAGGSLAAQTAIESITAFVKEHWGEEERTENLLKKAVHHANHAVRTKALADEKLHDMGTTCVCVLAHKEQAYMAHVGDSRAYLLRDGVFSLITEDHTVVQQLIKKGKVNPLEASYHPSAGILMRCLGQLEHVEPELHGPIDLKEGDRLLLCSDGLTGMIYEDEIAQALTDKDLETVTDNLIQMANEAGGFDNITVQLVQVGTLPEEASNWEIVVDSPEGLALMAAEGRAPPASQQGKLRHTLALPTAQPEEEKSPEPELPTAPAEDWKPKTDRVRLLLLTFVVVALLAAGLVYFVFLKK